MGWRNRLAIIVFGIGAAFSAVWGIQRHPGVLTMLDAGGGVFGSSSVGLLGYLLPAVITLWLSGRIRNLGSPRRLLRRVYLVATLALLSVFALVVRRLFFDWHVFGGGIIGWIFLVGTFIAGALWLPVQAFFAAGCLGLLIKGRTPTTASIEGAAG